MIPEYKLNLIDKKLLETKLKEVKSLIEKTEKLQKNQLDSIKK